MLRKEVTVKDPAGLHLRVAAGLVEIARAHNSQVQVTRGICENCPKASACSILDLITLGASQGTQLVIRVDGPDEQKTIAAISDYFENGGGI